MAAQPDAARDASGAAAAKGESCLGKRRRDDACSLGVGADDRPRIVVLTGVTAGLGKAMLLEFLRRGHTVFGCGRREALLNELRQQAVALPGKCDLEAVDVVDHLGVERWAKRVLNLLAGSTPDLLLNNAGVSFEAGGPGTPQLKFWELPKEQFDTTFDVNVKGVANVTRAFLPAMVGRASGVIVNWSSGLGRSTNPILSAYSASKFAIESLTKCIAQSLPDGMAAIPLAPGLVASEMLTGNFPTAEAWALDAVPYILSFGPSHNGQSLSVPGYYDEAYRNSWVIKDGQTIPPLGMKF